VESYIRGGGGNTKIAVGNFEYRFPVFQMFKKHARLGTEKVYNIQYIM